MQKLADMALNQKEKSREYYLKNKEIMLKKMKRWVEKNRQRSREIKAKWRKNNKEKQNASNNAWRNRRYLSDPGYRAECVLKSRLTSVLKRRNLFKTESIKFTHKELKEHLEGKFLPGMTWDNYGKEWHIDHIIPCAAFDLTNHEHVKFCFSLSNLRPLWAKDNISKGAKMPEGVVVPFELKAI